MNPILFCGFFSLASPVGSHAPEAAELSIRASDLLAHVFFLAGDDLRGREAGSEEEKISARYLAECLASYGVKPAGGGGSFFQLFEHEGENGNDLAMRNVAGWIEGTDPEKRQEFVVLGAHFDHVGLGDHGSLEGKRGVHNGADDNGSGTASLLELAQAFAMAPPKRSILVLHFSGEEKGLWGSEAACDEPARPLEKAVAMINMDMVGRSRDRYLFVGGTGTGEGFPDLVQRHATIAGLELETKSGGMAPSDNSNFFARKVPVLFLFTNIHDDYHASGDDWWKLEYESQEAITRMAYRIAREIADAPQRPAFLDDPGMGLPKDFMKRMTDLMQKRGLAPKPKKRGKPPGGEKGE